MRVAVRMYRLAAAAGAAAAVALAAGCSTAAGTAAAGTGTGAGSGSSRHIVVVAAENFWGSIARQLGGTHVSETSIIANPNTDPHDYEPAAGDARTIAGAQLVIVNGIGYDPWAPKLLAANPVAGRLTLTVGSLLGLKDGDNPHQWYSAAHVRQVIAAITASESIVSPLADALGLKMLTPYSFLRAISEGSEPTAQDKATVDAQIRNKQIKIYVYNSQNATPDVTAQVKEAEAEHIPVTTVTETLAPANATFQQWQVTELQGIENALHQATGK